ncbi:MAG: AAA family ATPase [Verrucomicrobia bacterium]|nr:AAA family ATPase [Verrucomicrobiota bacterium]
MFTATAYKVSQYVFSGYQKSRFKPLFSSVAATTYLFILKVQLKPEWIEKCTLSVVGYVGGVLTALFVIVIKMMQTDDEEGLEVRVPTKNYKTPRKDDYKEILPEVNKNNLIFITAPKGVDKVDFVNYYISENSRKIHLLPPKFCNAESIKQYASEIISFCEASKAILYIDASNGIEEWNWILPFLEPAIGCKVKVLVAWDHTLPASLPSKATQLFLPPASIQATSLMLQGLNKEISVEELKYIMLAAAYLPEAFPGSAVKIYKEYLALQKRIPLLEYLRIAVKVEPIWIETDMTSLAKLLNESRETISKDLVGIKSILNQINALLLSALSFPRTGKGGGPLASFILSGPSGYGKTSIAEGIAENLFHSRLLRTSLEELDAGELPAFKEKLSSFSSYPRVILIEGIDYLHGAENSLIPVNSPSLPFVLSLLKGEHPELRMERSLIIMTATKESAIDADFLNATKLIPINYKGEARTQLFHHLYTKVCEEQRKWSREVVSEERELKTECESCESPIEIENLLRHRLIEPLVLGKLEGGLSLISHRSTYVRTWLSKKGDSFVTALPPSPKTHAWQRETTLKELLQALLNGPGAILVGPTGAGKSDLIQKFAQENPQNREIIRLNQTNFASDSKFMGQFQDHVKELNDRVKANKSVLVIEGATLLVPEVREELYKFAPQLEEMIEEGGFSTILSVTEEEYKKLKLQSPKLIGQLKRVDVKPLTEKESLGVLQKIKPELERKLSCRFEEKAFSALLKYAHYLNGSLPGSAIIFLERMTVAEQTTVSELQILNSLSLQLHIGLEWLQEKHPGFQPKIEQAKKSLKIKIHGQDKAIDEICDTIRTRHMRVSPSQTKTLGSFLLKGPPGVGKTFFAQSLSDELFEKNFIRIDMQHLIDYSRLVKLTEHGGLFAKLNEQPFAVVLLDEIEKAPVEAQEALLGILQDGRFIDKKGFEVRFDQAVIVMTTNAQRLDQSFRPEFLNRLTVVEFSSLSHEAQTSLVKDKLELIKANCKEQDLTVTFEESAVNYFVEKLQRQINARDLDRLLEREVSNKLSSFEVNKKITVTGETNSLTFKAS